LLIRGTCKLHPRWHPSQNAILRSCPTTSIHSFPKSSQNSVFLPECVQAVDEDIREASINHPVVMPSFLTAKFPGSTEPAICNARKSVPSGRQRFRRDISIVRLRSAQTSLKWQRRASLRHTYRKRRPPRPWADQWEVRSTRGTWTRLPALSAESITMQFDNGLGEPAGTSVFYPSKTLRVRHRYPPPWPNIQGKT